MAAIVVAVAAFLASARPAAAQTDSADGTASPETVGKLEVARVFFEDSAALHILVSRLDVWEVNHRQGYVVAAAPLQILDDLVDQGFRVEVDDVQSTAAHALLASLAPGGTPLPELACYRTVEQTYADLKELAADYPSMVRWVDIGDSWDKVTAEGPPGYDLRALVISNQKEQGKKFPFVILAAIHAREMVTAEGAVRFAENLLSAYGVDPEVTWLLDYGELHIIPFGNPDGRKFAEQGILWRKNTHNDGSCGPPISGSSYGVDLNRNSSFKWNGCEAGACSSAESCKITYRGSSSASEPETKILQAYLAKVFGDHRKPELDAAAPMDTSGLFVSLHSYSRLVLYPWAWSGTVAPNGAELKRLGEQLAQPLGYASCQTGEPGCLYQADGTTDDWAYGELGIASYTVELGDAFFESCSVFEDQMMPDLEEALLVGFQMAREPYRLPAGPQSASISISPTDVITSGMLTVTVSIVSGASEEPIAGAAIFLDEPPWLGGEPIELAAVDGSFDGLSELASASLSTADWPEGKRLLFVESRDAAENVGPPGSFFVRVPAEADPPAKPAQTFFPWVDGRKTR
jgi:hypothetical protein